MSIFWFIFWGTKRTLKKLGYVADFCPLCRKIQPFSVSRVGQVGHIYYISFGDGHLVGYVSECQTCHLNSSANPTLYRTVNKTLSPNLTSLIQDTFPDLDQYHRDRLDIEEQIKRNPRSLSANTRSALIEEPFHLLSPPIEAHLSGPTHFDRQSGLGCFATIVMFILLAAVAHLVPDWLAGFGWLLIFSGVIYTIIQLGLSNHRYLQRDVVPLLARCLQPLNPTLDELQASLNKLAILKQRLGRRLKAQELFIAIEKLRTNSVQMSNR